MCLDQTKWGEGGKGGGEAQYQDLLMNRNNCQHEYQFRSLQEPLCTALPTQFHEDDKFLHRAKASSSTSKYSDES